MDEEVVTELIQEKCNSRNISVELKKIIEPNHRNHVLKKYDILESKLGGIGASKKTAQLIIRNLK